MCEGQVDQMETKVDQNDGETVSNSEEEVRELGAESSGAVDEERATLQKELESLKQFKEKYYYLAAETENLKKRHQRERESLIKYGNDKILSSLIEVVDNLERTQDAIKNDEDDKIKNIFNGIEMVHRSFLSKLKESGLEQIESLGKKFDPNFHEAMAQHQLDGKENEEIIQEYQKGYILNGRLLRAAKVIVVKN